MANADPVHFGLFDKDAEIAQSRRYLPHWFQPNVAVFLTFRTADSMPMEVVARWHDELRVWLRRADLATIVGDSIRHFDGERYDLDRFVVMPNHVHVLVQFRPPTTCHDQCTSWLHFTAVRINRVLGRKREFWQSEPFDHLVRSEEQFIYLQRYIEENPDKANLKPGEYLFWKRM